MPKIKQHTVTLNPDQIECITRSIKLYLKGERAMIDHYTRQDPRLSSRSPVLKPYFARVRTAEAIIDLLKNPKSVVKYCLTTHPDGAYIIPASQVRATWDYNEQLLQYDPTHKGALMLKNYLSRTFGDISIPPISGELKPTPNNNPF